MVGWHIPSNADWDALMTAVGGAFTAGTKLKATSGWNAYNGVPAGTDEFGFSTLPGGGIRFDGYVYDVGNFGNWWSTSELSGNYAYGRYIGYDREYVGYYGDDGKSSLISVRCLHD